MESNIKRSWYRPEWQEARVEFILNIYGADFFKGKRILELGSCSGYIGAFFKNLGADVLAVEGRDENIEKIKLNYPDLNVVKFDLDTPNWEFGKWDIIINFGLFYHLEKYHTEHLENCLKNCDMMFFESVIYDSPNDELYFYTEYGFDQSLSNVGGNPTTSFVENIFKKNNFVYTKIITSVLNKENHFYDWVDTYNNVFNRFQRRFWICKYKNK